MTRHTNHPLSRRMRVLPSRISAAITCAFGVALLVSQTSCGGSDDATTPPTSLPQLSAATPATLSANCAGLATSLSLPNTTITSATPIAAGGLVVAGAAQTPAHCLVSGYMFPRIGPIVTCPAHGDWLEETLPAPAARRAPIGSIHARSTAVPMRRLSPSEAYPNGNNTRLPVLTCAVRPRG